MPQGINHPHALRKTVTPSARSTALPRPVTQVYKVHVVAAPERCSRPSAARWPGGWRRRQSAAAELGPLEGGAAPPRQAKHRAAPVGLAPVRRQGAVLPASRARIALPLAAAAALAARLRPVRSILAAGPTHLVRVRVRVRGRGRGRGRVRVKG